jgi:hypothetical protein
MICSGQFEDTSTDYLAQAFKEMGVNVLRGMLYEKGILYNLDHYPPKYRGTRWDIFEEK